MGYLSNGSEGERYEHHICERCQHYGIDADGEGDGCAVWMAHLLYNYDQVKGGPVESILSMLIPVRGIENDVCKMFVPVDDAAREHAAAWHVMANTTLKGGE